MSNLTPTDLAARARTPGLARRILNGEVIVLRGALQHARLLEPIANATVDGIRATAGEDAATLARTRGFERIHEWVAPGDIPKVTDGVYKVMAPMAHDMLTTLVPALFPDAGSSYYYERSPNIRFHIPYALTLKHRREFDKFAEKHGQGKIAAHGPHRDQWVDCPANAINVWIAIGPVTIGNGLTVYAEDFNTEFRFQDGYVENGERLHKPMTFDLAPGDAVLFRSNHLHGSELNRTDSTRYVVSFRVTFGKPHYPHGHYHHYLHGGLASGPLRPLAGIPQNLQGSFFRYQVQRLRYKLTGRGRMTGADSAAAHTQPKAVDPLPVDGSIALADLPVGAVKPVSKTICVARLDEHQVVAIGRHCPHAGGDLTGGWIDNGQVVCPLHALPIDPQTGESACAGLKAVKRYPCEIRQGRVHVGTQPVPAAAPAPDAYALQETGV